MADGNGFEKVGALWAAEDKNGSEYFYGSLEVTDALKEVVEAAGDGDRIRILAFVNNFKEQDSHPDFQMYLQPEDEGRGKKKSYGKKSYGKKDDEDEEEEDSGPRHARSKPHSKPTRGGKPSGYKGKGNSKYSRRK